jgi:POT family proton-dependent oligopeptide transporter
MCIYCAFAVFKSSTQERPKLLVLLVIIPFLILFYGLQSQLYFVINLFAKRNLETDILGHSIPSTVIQAIAPFAAIFVGLFLGHLLKTTTQSDNSKEGFTRFGIGLLGPVLCFFILYWGCIQATEGRVQYLYILSLGFIGAAEALIGPFAYNQATVLAPNHMKGYAMSIVLVAIAFGNLATIFSDKIKPEKKKSSTLTNSNCSY